MKLLCSVVMVLALAVCSISAPVHGRPPFVHPRKLERMKRHRGLDNNELDDFTFSTAVRRAPNILVLFYSSNCRECENIKREMIEYSRLDGPRENIIGFVNIERNPLVAKDMRMPRGLNEFKIALLERNTKEPKMYDLPNYNAHAFKDWVESNLERKHEPHRVQEQKPYEEINKLVFKKGKFQIKTWHKVLFFGAAGIGIALVSYLIKKDLNSRHRFKTHVV